jgi:hypothetical protein
MSASTKLALHQPLGHDAAEGRAQLGLVQLV